MTTIPVGGVVGGLIAGFDPAAVLINNIPIAIVSIGLAIGFKLWPKAVRKLTESGMTVTEAALSSGYGDVSHFYKAFEARYGCSPKQYREQRKKEG